MSDPLTATERELARDSASGSWIPIRGHPICCSNANLGERSTVPVVKLSLSQQRLVRLSNSRTLPCCQKVTIDELRMHLTRLVNNYVPDVAEKARIFALVARDDIPEKGVLRELTSYLSGVVTDADAAIIRDITFNFC